MTKAQTLELRASAIREKLNELSGAEDLTDEQREEIDALSKEYRDVEAQRRAAIVADDVQETEGGEIEDAEVRERRELRSKARIGDFLTALLKGRPVTGASAEYADAVGVDTGDMPFDLLIPEEREGQEERAVTPGPSSDAVTTTRPTVPFPFARTDAAALGISMPMVPPGEAHYPTLTTAPPASPKAKDAAADATAAAFGLTKRTPGRVTGQFVVRVEDIALFPSMESDLRTAISDRVADALDNQVFLGDGSAPNLNGLFNQASDVNRATATETFATGVARFAALVDGTHANGWGDVRALIGTATFAKYASLFQSNGDMSLYDYLMGKLGALRVSTRVPVVASMAQKGIAVLTAQGQGVTMPVWSGVEFVVDPYTQAGRGQRVITATTLVGSPFVPYGNAQVKEFHPKLS